MARSVASFLPLIALAAGGGILLATKSSKAAATTAAAVAARAAALPRYDVAIPADVSKAVDAATGTPGDSDVARLRAFALRLSSFPIAQSAVTRFADSKGGS